MLGIEAVGVVDTDPDGGLAPGQQVATLMGGMGRVFDGGYAEYTLVPGGQVIPFTTDLPWEVIGAVPETLQTAYGSLTTGLDLAAGQTLVVRGGTSSVGLAAITVAAPTRRGPAGRTPPVIGIHARSCCSTRCPSAEETKEHAMRFGMKTVTDSGL